MSSPLSIPSHIQYSLLMGEIVTRNHEDQSEPLAKARKVSGSDLGDGAGAKRALDANVTAIPSVTMLIQADSGTPTTTYVGYAKPGSGASGAADIWKILRISIQGSATLIDHCDGDLEFDNIWDNREALTYEV
jgi:hypothetical protein